MITITATTNEQLLIAETVIKSSGLGLEYDFNYELGDFLYIDSCELGEFTKIKLLNTIASSTY